MGSVMGDHLSPIAVTNRYSFPVMIQVSGVKKKIMPGATYTGPEFIQGGFYCSVYDVKGKLIRRLEFPHDALDRGTHDGVFKFDVGP